MMTDTRSQELFEQIKQALDEHNAWPQYRSDILIYDKVWLFENPNTTFLFVATPTGSHVIPLSTKMNVVRYEFAKANAISKLPDCAHYWLARPGNGLVKLTREEAFALVNPN
jgi:hypothetical protein